MAEAKVNEGMSFYNKFCEMFGKFSNTPQVQSNIMSGKTMLFRKRTDNLKPNGICLGSPYDIAHHTVNVLDVEPKNVIIISETEFNKRNIDRK